MPDSNHHYSLADWRFSRDDGSVIVPRLRLQPGGTIANAFHPNETYWAVINGNLCFLNEDRETTTEFFAESTNAEGEPSLRGHFLDPGSGVVHILTKIPKLFASHPSRPAPRVAVLVRTHLMNEKVNDLLWILADSGCFDLFVCADCTREELSFEGIPVLRHREGDAESLGLPSKGQNLLWYCGDYALLFAHREIPHYDYYIMLEFDVDLMDRSPLLIEGIINRLGFATPSAIDFVGCRTAPGDFADGWGATVAGFYPEARTCLFPFVVVSRAAVEYLLAERRSEKNAALQREQPMFCEAFVPSALLAGGFKCVDLNELLPGAVDPDTFRISESARVGPMLLGHKVEADRAVKIIHPVFDEDAFVTYHLREAAETGDTAVLEQFVTETSAVALSETATERIARELRELKPELADE